MPSGLLLLLILGPTADEPAPDAARRELERHQGTWVVTRFVHDGQEADPEVAGSIRRVVAGNHVTWRRDGTPFAGSTIELDPARMPATIDVLPDGGPARDRRVLGIYRLDGATLTICMAAPEAPRPSDFEAPAGSGRTLMTFRRDGP